MLRTPYWVGVWGLASTSILAIFTLPSNSAARSLTTGGDHLAGAAPVRPEVHKDRNVGLDHLALKCVVADVDRVCHVASGLFVGLGARHRLFVYLGCGPHHKGCYAGPAAAADNEGMARSLATKSVSRSSR